MDAVFKRVTTKWSYVRMGNDIDECDDQIVRKIEYCIGDPVIHDGVGYHIVDIQWDSLHAIRYRISSPTLSLLVFPYRLSLDKKVIRNERLNRLGI